MLMKMDVATIVMSPIVVFAPATKGVLNWACPVTMVKYGYSASTIMSTFAEIKTWWLTKRRFWLAVSCLNMFG